MAFTEQIIKEYDPFLKRNTFTKEVRVRVRLLQRPVEGIFRTFIDIREYIITEKRAIFTGSGVYFDKKETEKLISYLQDSLKHFSQKGEADGNRLGTSYPSGSKTKEELL